MIPLYRNDAGKEIQVRLTPVYEAVRDRSVEFLVGSPLEIFIDRLERDLPQLVLGVMAVLVGIVFFCVAIYNQMKKRGGENLAALGLFSIMMGLWRLADTRFTPFLVPEKPILAFYVSTGMLLIGLVPLIRSIRWRCNPVSRRILDGCCIGVSVICILQLLLQIFGGVDLRENFLVIHVTIAVGAALIIGNLIYDGVRYRKEIVNKRMPIILVVGILMDLAFYYVKGNSSGLLFSLLAMLIYILFAGIHMMRRCAEQEKQLAEKDRMLAERERQLTENRITTLVSQIRPHFIYNTLGSIEQLCELQPETAAKLVHDFSCYLRGNFGELDNHAPIRLSQEMEHVRHYINIEQIRFPDIEFRLDMQSGDILIPALSVQPLVENAVKHGLMRLPHGGTVTVSSCETNTSTCIRVEDNGAGFDTKILLDERKHIGLRNIRQRVEIMCGGTLTVESMPGVGTKVVISIPREGKK